MMSKIEMKMQGLILQLTQCLREAHAIALEINEQAVERGRKGGTKTAERGPEYFRRIATLRKKLAGGRPRKGSK